MNTFPTISGADWHAAMQRAKTEPNLVMQQLVRAVEAALQDAESAIADAEESQLRVVSESLYARARMYRRALDAYRAGQVSTVKQNAPAHESRGAK